MVTRKSTGISSRRNADGSMSFTAQLLVKPYPRSSQTFPTMAAAVAWRKQMREELLKQRELKSTRPDLPKLTLAALVAEYLRDSETTSLADFKDRKRQLTWWTLKFGTVKVLDFGVMHGREALDMLTPGRAAGTINRTLAAMRACWNWGRAAGLVPQDRTWPPQLMRSEPRGRTRCLTAEELGKVLVESQKTSPVALAALTVALATGVRRGELLRLTWADVDFDRATIRLLLTKTGEARAVHLPSIAAEALQAIKPDPATGSVFRYTDGTPMTGDRLHQAWCEIRKSAGLVDFRWHDLRHSCASFLAQNGSSLVEIGSVLGHKRAQTTLRYSHLVAGKAVTGHSALDALLRASKPS
jgi:integrase